MLNSDIPPKVNTQNNWKTPPPMTHGTIFVYLSVPIQMEQGAELTARTAHVRDLPYEEAVADPEKTRRLWDTIRTQDTPPGARLKLLGIVSGGENADEEVSRLMQKGIDAESDILQRLTEESAAGNA